MGWSRAVSVSRVAQLTCSIAATLNCPLISKLCRKLPPNTSESLGLALRGPTRWNDRGLAGYKLDTREGLGTRARMRSGMCELY